MQDIRIQQILILIYGLRLITPVVISAIPGRLWGMFQKRALSSQPDGCGLIMNKILDTGRQYTSVANIELFILNKVKFKSLCSDRNLKLMFLLFGLYNPVASAAHDYLLWKTSSGAKGDIKYSGAAVDIITGNVKSLYTGTMSVIYKDCDSNAYANYRAEEKWIFFPTKIDINGQSVAISIFEPPSGYTVSSYGNYYILKQTIDTFSYGVDRKCSKFMAGDTYPINYTYPSFNIELDVSGLSVGDFSGTIPVKMAYAEYFNTSSNITFFSDSQAFEYSSDSEVSYAINITNKCTITPESLSLEHGALQMEGAEGNTVSKTIVFFCEEPASFSVNLQSRNIPSPVTSYSDGVGVDLGNGWVSDVTICNSGLSDVSLTGKTISVPVGGLSCPVSSSVRKNGTVTSGSISGSLVIALEFK